MTVNISHDWLEGIRARVAGAPRAACPFGQNKIDVGNSDIIRANEWFSGWDTANIILDLHDAKEPA